MTDDAEVVTMERRGDVALITLNRPRARNAVNTELRTALTAAVLAAGDDPEVRAVVLTGAGSAFCAGGDVKAMRDRLETPPGEVARAGWMHQRRRTHRLVAALHRLEKPTIAAVNGPAAGLGADLALACDFVVASEAAMFIYSYMDRGLIPDGGGLYLLPRRVGLSKAKEIIYTARRIPADEALALGIADRLAPGDELVAQSVAWAGELSRGSPVALGLAKSILDEGFERTLDDVMALGAQAQAICYSSAEHREAVRAFLDGLQRRSKPAAAPVDGA
jgi:enoyl-CoA hydratase/carnithine racemase